jgi:hypothetical protein
VTPERYYRATLLLPLVVPVVATPLAFAIPEPGRFPLLAILLVPTFSLICGGLPYLVVALVTIWRLGGRPPDEQWTQIKRLPLVFGLVLFAACVAWSAISGWHDVGRSLRDGCEYGALLAGFGAGLGYVYVLIASALYRLLRRHGLIEEKPTEIERH